MPRLQRAAQRLAAPVDVLDRAHGRHARGGVDGRADHAEPLPQLPQRRLARRLALLPSCAREPRVDIGAGGVGGANDGGEGDLLRRVQQRRVRAQGEVEELPRGGLDGVGRRGSEDGRLGGLAATAAATAAAAAAAAQGLERPSERAEGRADHQLVAK